MPLPPPAQTQFDDETTRLLFDVFAERYRLELAAEEDVFRTMPFFATSLGLATIPFGYLATACKWAELWWSPHAPRWWIGGVGVLATGGFALAVSAVFILLDATRLRNHARPLDEEWLLRWTAKNLARRPASLGPRLQRLILRNYARVSMFNRALNRTRYLRRADAARCLIVSLLLSLSACAATFTLKQAGILP